MKDMSGSGPNGGTTRRLPSWMLASQAKKPGIKSKDRVNEVEHPSDGVGSVSRSTTHNENKKSKDKPGSMAEGGRKRGREKTNLEDAGSDVEIQDIVAEGKGNIRGAKRVRESAPRGRIRRKEKIPVAEDDESCSITCAGGVGDDLDLTVEDLMSIANEYVSAANEDLKERKLSRVESGIGKSTTETRNVQVDPVDAISIGPKPPSSSIRMCLSSEETVAGEETVVQIERTGDPAQDMLNLLLGPLLNKKVNEEKKKDELSGSSLQLTEEVSQGRAANVNRETIPQSKKKTSLKEKISMFFE